MSFQMELPLAFPAIEVRIPSTCAEEDTMDILCREGMVLIKPFSYEYDVLSRERVYTQRLTVAELSDIENTKFRRVI